MTRVAKTFAKVLDGTVNKLGLMTEFEKDFKAIVDPKGFYNVCTGEDDFAAFLKEDYYIGVLNPDVDDLLVMAWLAYRNDKKRAGKVILKTLAMWVKDLKEEQGF